MSLFEPDRNAINNTQKWLFNGGEKFEDTKGVMAKGEKRIVSLNFFFKIAAFLEENRNGLID
jgi:hypothetical protein